MGSREIFLKVRGMQVRVSTLLWYILILTDNGIDVLITSWPLISGMKASSLQTEASVVTVVSVTASSLQTEASVVTVVSVTAGTHVHISALESFVCTIEYF